MGFFAIFLILSLVVVNTIQKLYKQENHLHKEFLDTQDKYRRFEQEKIIDVYTELFQTFEDYRIQHRLENLEGVLKVASIFSAIETDAEWLYFLHHHENELVKQTAAFKDEISFDFPNVSHPLVQPVMVGTLQRSHGKKWIEEYYVLSPGKRELQIFFGFYTYIHLFLVGLLHRYKTQNDFTQAPLKPQVTMFIPQCTILVNPTSHLLEVRGKTSTGLFGTKKLFELSSNDPNALKLWIDILDRMALQKDIPIHRQVDTRSIHSKVLAEDDHQQESSSGSAENTAESMQPIVEESTAAAAVATPHIAPITNTPSHIADDDDDQDDFRNETIEYSTHTPIDESPPPHDTKNPFVTTNEQGENHYPQDTLKTPPGLTREGSDLYWDTATTTNLDK